MKKLIICAFAILMLCSCNPIPSGDGNNENMEETKFTPQSFLFTAETLPEKIDLDMDVDGMMLEELRLLRNYPYALKGLWFTEADINSFFTYRSKWYYDRCCEYLNKHDYEPLLDYDKAGISADEQAFVDRIDEKIEEMNADRQIEVDGYMLSKPNLAVNLFQVEDLDKDFFKMLCNQNFAICPTNNEQLFNIYEENDYAQMPSYVTTDLFLQAYHMYFSYVLKTLEKKVFVPCLHNMNVGMYNEAMNVARSSSDAEIVDLAEFSATFFAVADKLLMENSPLMIPASYDEVANIEIENIMNEVEDFSPMMNKNTTFAYDLFKPRGHYTRSEAQKRYFRSMMWIQCFIFPRENQASMKQAAMLAYLFNHADSEKMEAGRGMFDALSFLMGEPDNVAIIEIADFMKQKGLNSVNDVVKSSTLKSIDGYLAQMFKTRNKITSKVQEEGMVDIINFMPQRYMPDSEVLANMYDPTPNAERGFPRGLDVFAAFGIDHASNIIDEYYDDASKWDGYASEAKNMRDKFQSFSDWDKTMYNKWFESLVTLQHSDKNYPGYMQTPSWSTKSLNSALASWAELKHDAILYGEQPMCAECGGGEDFPEPMVVGYVEPNLAFWKKMKEMLALTHDLLKANKLWISDIGYQTDRLNEYMDFCIKVSKKELAGTPLDEEEYKEIRVLGSSIEWFTLQVLDPDLELDNWGLVEGADRSVAVVADVYTRNLTGCKKCGILYEATGTADAIYVVVEIGGKLYLTKGATLSYYEFINPLGNRLTDEEWQEKLKGDDAPGRPVWMKPLILSKEPVLNEQIFYSTGC